MGLCISDMVQSYQSAFLSLQQTFPRSLKHVYMVQPGWITHMNSLPFHQDIAYIHKILNFTSLFSLTEYVERALVFIEDVVNALILHIRWKIRTGVGESEVKMSGSLPTLIQSGKVTHTYSLLTTHASRADMRMDLNPGVKGQMIGEEFHGINVIKCMTFSFKFTAKVLLLLKLSHISSEHKSSMHSSGIFLDQHKLMPSY